MTFKPAIWLPIAVVLGVVNLVAAGFAAASAEAGHAVVHVVLAGAFGLWAQRLRQVPPLEAGEMEPRLEALEDEMGNVRRELSEAQERLDFAERMLAQGQESRRMGPER